MELLGAIVNEYKSVSDAKLPLSGLTVLVGPNGVGKTNLIEALGVFDPLAGPALRRPGGSDARPPSVGLVTRFMVTADGSGPDAEALRIMVTDAWKDGEPVANSVDGIGAYCTASWWMHGAALSDPKAPLRTVLATIADAILDGVPDSHQRIAKTLVVALFDQPVVIVQDDFAVYLSCEPERLGFHSESLEDLLRVLDGDCLLTYVISSIMWEAARPWPVLFTLARGPVAGARDGVPPGYDWVTRQLGGVRVLSGDVVGLETHLAELVEVAHDYLLHRPGLNEYYLESPDSNELSDEDCLVCLGPSHGGRVVPSEDGDDGPPSMWAARNERLMGVDEGEEIQYAFSTTDTWLEESASGWVRPRKTIATVLKVIEDETNRRLPAFVAAQGVVRLVIRPIPEWDAAPSRCRVMFELQGLERDDEPSTGEVELGGLPPQDHDLLLPLADLGAGLRRWAATTVRLAAEACCEDTYAVVTAGDLAGGDQGAERDIVDVVASPERGRILLVDEPEQHLHPAAQEEIAQWCAVAAGRHHSVLVATHSPAFLALPSHQANLMLVRRTARTTTVSGLPAVHGPDVIARSRAAGFDLGLGRDALVQLTRAVMVVEGEWDRIVLHDYFGEALAADRVLVVPLQGSDEVGSMADVAVIPSLGVPTILLLDEVFASCWDDLDRHHPPLTKAERALRDLRAAIEERVHLVRYPDPDIMCGLPEAAVQRAFPDAAFPGWEDLLAQWRADGTQDSFKKWAPRRMGLPKRQRPPFEFFRAVQSARLPSDVPGRSLSRAVKQALSLIDPAPS